MLPITVRCPGHPPGWSWLAVWSGSSLWPPWAGRLDGPRHLPQCLAAAPLLVCQSLGVGSALPHAPHGPTCRGALALWHGGSQAAGSAPLAALQGAGGTSTNSVPGLCPTEQMGHGSPLLWAPTAPSTVAPFLFPHQPHPLSDPLILSSGPHPCPLQTKPGVIQPLAQAWPWDSLAPRGRGDSCFVSSLNHRGGSGRL